MDIYRTIDLATIVDKPVPTSKKTQLELFLNNLDAEKQRIIGGLILKYAADQDKHDFNTGILPYGMIAGQTSSIEFTLNELPTKLLWLLIKFMTIATKK